MSEIDLRKYDPRVLAAFQEEVLASYAPQVDFEAFHPTSDATWMAENYYLDEGRWDPAGHYYLEEMLMDNSPDQATQKGTQLGVSEAYIARALKRAGEHGWTVIYLFPGGGLGGDFSQQRVAPAIERSPRLRSLLDRRLRIDVGTEDEGKPTPAGQKTANRMGLKKLGEGWLFLRGASRLNLISIPADLIIFDEYDEMGTGVAPVAEQRLLHSRYKWQMKLSKPTRPNYGINAEYNAGTQGRWEIQCEGCNLWQELKWFRNVLLDKRLVVCRKCHRPIDRTRRGRWRHPFETRTKKTRRISGLACARTNVEEGPLNLIDEWREIEEKKDPRRLEEFWRGKMGVPYIAEGSGLTETLLRGAIREHHLLPRGSDRPCIMGVDIGSIYNHYLIWQFDRERYRLVWGGKVEKFEELDGLIRLYRVVKCVVDAEPEARAAKEFAARHPGRVVLAFFNNTPGAELISKIETKQISPSELRTYQYVKIARTEMFDRVMSGLGFEQELAVEALGILPMTERGMEGKTEYVEHMIAPTKTIRETRGTLEAVWQSGRPDHLYLANVYGRAAWELAKGTGMRPRIQLVGRRPTV